MTNSESQFSRFKLWERTLFSWKEIVEQVGTARWRATVVPLTEPFLTGFQPIPAQEFDQQYLGMEWCSNQIRGQWFRVFGEWRLVPSNEDRKLYKFLIDLLQHRAFSTSLNLAQACLGYWEQYLSSTEESQQTSLRVIEPVQLFLELTTYFPSEKGEVIHNYLHQGTLKLDVFELTLEGLKLARYLAKLSSYPTINVFSRAVSDWLESSDLGLDSVDQKQRLDVINQSYRGFYYLIN